VDVIPGWPFTVGGRGCPYLGRWNGSNGIELESTASSPRESRIEAEFAYCGAWFGWLQPGDLAGQHMETLLFGFRQVAGRIVANGQNFIVSGHLRHIIEINGLCVCLERTLLSGDTKVMRENSIYALANKISSRPKAIRSAL
jgi:hypothetical protein